MLPADQRQVPFGPDVSWPAGYSDMEYRDGGHRHTTPQAQPPAPAQGQHPYAAFSSSGYGDDGYSDPGYQGPAAQDAGIAGTRMVRGFVEQGQAPGGYAQPGYPQGDSPQGQGYPQDHGYGQPGYAGSSYVPAGDIEVAYPPAAPAAEEQYGAESYRQPWDYGQPLRYDGGVAYPGPRDGYHEPGYDPAAYNGSDYSRPGIEGAGYDLSGIIGTSDFEAVGYDEPSYDRLSYDDPRYDETPRYSDPRDSGRRSAPRFPDTQFPDTQFDRPRYDETRLDNLWPAGDGRPDATPAGYGDRGYAGGPVRSGYSDLDLGEQDYRFDETRLDLSAAAVLDMDHTRFDVPPFDETRLDMRTGVLLAPSAARPQSWAEDTSLDHFADLDLTDEPVPAAFTRTLRRPQDDDTAARRAIGKRRGRSGDRRHWMALGAIAVVAAGAIGGVLMKYVFTGPTGPAHKVVAASTVDGYTRSPDLEKQMKVSTLAQSVAKSSSGSVSDVQSAVYEMGNTTTPGAGSNAQIFMFVGGKLVGADPSASVANFKQAYPAAHLVSAGSLGGDAACTEAVLNHESVSMCVWFDNDTFGAVVSPTMTTAKLATTMDSVRPSLEHYAK